uniref:Armadillo repeat containing 3 n=1 Tax=Tetraodon nigroviridis TaxID=99883 RepID=H3CRS9_TETNG
FVALNLEIKSPATAVLLLNSSEEDIVVKVCNGIYSFAEKGDNNKVYLLGLGVLDPLCQLVTHSHVLVRRKAVMILGTMATNSDVKNTLKNIDVIPSIVDCLSLEGESAWRRTKRETCANESLVNLSFSVFFQIPWFMSLKRDKKSVLGLSKPSMLSNCVLCYHDGESATEAHKLGAIPPLLKLLNSDFPVIQHLALKTLENVSMDENTLMVFREDKGLETLMSVLSNADFSDLHIETLKVLSNCLRDSESVEEIHRNEGLEKLLEFILTSTQPEIHFSAIKCITRVAENSDIQKLKKHNVEKILVNLLSAAQGHDVKTAVCEAVRVMSPVPASADCFRDRAIPEIVKLLDTKGSGLRGAATQALCSLMGGGGPNALAVFKAGGHTRLIGLLGGDSPAMVANSAAAICNMAGQETIHSSLLLNGVVSALVKPLSSTNTLVLVNTLHCLEVLVCDAQTRAELQSAKGLQPLVNLLRSNDKEVLQNACIVISGFASDKVTAVRLYQLGALEMLQEINQSPTRRTTFSRTAMITLLNFNLPVKFGLMGQLASTDKIGDGFYDVGKVEGVDKILTLEELSKQPINNRQPIIVVNTGSRSILTTKQSFPSNVPQVSLSNAEELCLMSKELNGYFLFFFSKRTVSIIEVKEDASAKMFTSSKTKASPKTNRKTVNTNEHEFIVSLYREEDTSPKEKQNEPPKGTPWELTEDVGLERLVKEVKESIISLSDDRQKYAALARLVSKAMGGEIEMEKLHEFPWMLHLSQLKFELQSNIIPIGLISSGHYRHRALLFKCLVDSIGLGCTLTRGKSHCAWNEVLLFPENSSQNVDSSEPSRYIVDLMHHPGHLMALNTPAAVHYMRL